MLRPPMPGGWAVVRANGPEMNAGRLPIPTRSWPVPSNSALQPGPPAHTS
jgi:hypothetical protein